MNKKKKTKRKRTNRYLDFVFDQCLDWKGSMCPEAQITYIEAVDKAIHFLDKHGIKVRVDPYDDL